jgi:hypothetical protein
MTRPRSDGGLGFRDMELFNVALLARQAWRILTSPNTLSARILKAAYFPDGDILSAELGTRPSQIWHAICEGRDALRLGLIKRIGCGEQTRISNENWLPRDSRRRPITAISNQPPLMISQLIDQPTRSWNMQQLNTHLLPMDIKIIRLLILGVT